MAHETKARKSKQKRVHKASETSTTNTGPAGMRAAQTHTQKHNPTNRSNEMIIHQPVVAMIAWRCCGKSKSPVTSCSSRMCHLHARGMEENHRKETASRKGATGEIRKRSSRRTVTVRFSCVGNWPSLRNRHRRIAHTIGAQWKLELRAIRPVWLAMAFCWRNCRSSLANCFIMTVHQQSQVAFGGLSGINESLYFAPARLRWDFANDARRPHRPRGPGSVQAERAPPKRCGDVWCDLFQPKRIIITSAAGGRN